tara:strand:+ start:341 stop:529 length:189 start_codon:yes stop_codon:yes gene_type:complete
MISTGHLVWASERRLLDLPGAGPTGAGRMESVVVIGIFPHAVRRRYAAWPVQPEIAHLSRVQ